MALKTEKPEMNLKYLTSTNKLCNNPFFFVRLAKNLNFTNVISTVSYYKHN